MGWVLILSSSTEKIGSGEGHGEAEALLVGGEAGMLLVDGEAGVSLVDNSESPSPSSSSITGKLSTHARRSSSDSNL